MSDYINNVSLPCDRLARLKEDYHQRWVELHDRFAQCLSDKRRAEEERRDRERRRMEEESYRYQHHSTSSSCYYGDDTTSRTVYILGSCSSAVQYVNVTPTYSCNVVSAGSTGYSRSDGRPIGITVRGKQCIKCLNDWNCPHH